MGKKLAEARNWNPIADDVIKSAFGTEQKNISVIDGGSNLSEAKQASAQPERPIMREETVFKQFRMAETDSFIVDQLLTGLRGDLGVKVTFTDLVHAMVFMLDKKREELRKESQKVQGDIRRPQLADGPAMREFQKGLANIFLDAVGGKSRFS